MRKSRLNRYISHGSALSFVAALAVTSHCGSSWALPGVQGNAAEAQDSDKFEVVSIRQHRSDNSSPNPVLRLPIFSYYGLSTKDIIMWAFELKEYQIQDLPAWAGADSYDILARSSDRLQGLPADEQKRYLKGMLRNMLIDRFKLKYRIEMENKPSLWLETEKGGIRAQVASEGEPESMIGEGTKWTLRGWSMARLARQLSAQLEKVVVDKTGDRKKYNFEIQWQDPDKQQPGMATTDSDFASELTRVLPDSIGVKLTSHKELLPVCLIESIDKPSSN